jgi:arylsulfatase A-like enzyme
MIYPAFSRTVAAFLAAGLLFPALHSVASGKEGERKAPNLIVIMTDDQGYADAGFNGCKDIPTPNMDRLAATGAVCTSAYVTYTVCAPSRAGFITGRYPQRFGFERNVAWQPSVPTTGLDVRETTLAAALRPHGYKSGLIGKWHLGAHDNFHPLNRGFDEFYGHLGGGHRYFPEELTIKNTLDCRNEPDSYKSWILRGFEPVRTERYLTEEFTREALDFVRRQKDNPFFLFLAYNAPHAPMQAPQEELARFAHIKNEKRRTYAAMLGVVDRGVGQMLDLLDELKIADDTIVFFLSDNGGPVSANASNNAPLRGAKSDPYEGGFRVPFAVRWPGTIPACIRFAEPVSSLDIFATIAAVNQIPASAARPLDGVNLLPYLRGEKTGAPHDRIYLRMFDTGAFAMREGDFKIVNGKKASAPALYNLANDISERTDLASREADRFEKMRATYEQWNAQLVEPAFPGLNMREWQQPQAGGTAAD